MLKEKLNLISKVIRNPRNITEISRYVKNDFDTLRGVYRYKHSIIFIAGLPKSGTTWLRAMLAILPGYNIRPIFDPAGTINRNDISDDIFQSLPKGRYSIIKTHTKYSEENFKIITRHADRFIVMIRDLRDMCVSRYNHIKNDRTHHQCQSYNELNKDQGIMDSINAAYKHHVPWVESWRKAANDHPNKILVVRYEQLNQALKETLKKVFRFYDLEVDASIIDKMLQTQLKGEADIQKSLEGIENRIGGLKSTARKGIIGDWRNHFNSEHKTRFKKLIGEHLIRLGYETDLNW